MAQCAFPWLLLVARAAIHPVHPLQITVPTQDFVITTASPIRDVNTLTVLSIRFPRWYRRGLIIFFFIIRWWLLPDPS